MQLPEALIFDMDGVLVDSEPLHKRAKELAFAEVGLILPESVYDSYKGRPDRTMMPEVLSAHGRASHAELVTERKKHFYEQIEHELQPIPGAAEFVRWAATRFRLALATSATPRNRAAALRMLQQHREDAVGGQAQAFAGKAHHQPRLQRLGQAVDEKPQRMLDVE